MKIKKSTEKKTNDTKSATMDGVKDNIFVTISSLTPFEKWAWKCVKFAGDGFPPHLKRFRVYHVASKHSSRNAKGEVENLLNAVLQQW